MDDDASLLLAWRAGDAAAGRRLVSRHFASVYRFFANKLGQDVDDLVQQTFLACVEGRDRLRDAAGFRAYLFAVARNRLMRHFRDRGSPGDEPVGDDLAGSRISVAEALAREHEQRLLLRALRRLPLDLQIAVELAYWEGLSDREVAAILELPVGTFKSRLRKARLLLAQAMSELADSPTLLDSTTAGLERWVVSIRAALDQASLR
jgi:RNA polymerase sigma-70 factor, ECF subfamily